MRRSTRILTAVWFIAILAIPGVASIFSERETIANRPVSEFPEADAEEILTGDFFENVDNFVEDRLSIRERAIETEATISFDVFSDSPNPEVYIGDDDFLFIAATFDRPCESDAEGVWIEPSTVTERIGALRFELEENNAEFFFTVVPEKAWVYPDLLPDSVENRDCADELVTDLRDELAGQTGYLDIFDLLLTEAPLTEDRLYQRTDTHWNSFGRAVAAEFIIDAIEPGLYDQDALVDLGEVDKPEGGDLAQLLGIDVFDRDVRLQTTREFITTETIEEVGAQRRWQSSTADTDAAPLIPGRTIVVTDSHLNTSASFFNQYFEDLHVIRWQDINDDNVEAAIVRPTE